MRMTMKRVLGVLVSLGLLLGCQPSKEEEMGGGEKKGNPLYEQGGNAGTNPLAETTHLAIDSDGKPVIVYAQKVVEKATSGLKDTVRTNVRVIRPDTEGDNAATELAADASPRALGTVKGVTRLLTESADGALRSTVVSNTPAELLPLTTFTSFGTRGSVHQLIVSIGGVAYATLRDTEGQSVLVEVGAATPATISVGKALTQNDVKFIAAGGENHREFAVAFEKSTAHVALSSGSRLGEVIDSGKTGKPLAVWTDGKTTKTLIDTVDGVVLFDGKASVALGTKVDALCRSATFTVDGAPFLLTVTTTDTSIITTDTTSFTEATTSIATGDLVDCTLAVNKENAHGAWRVMRAPTDDARIDSDVIDYVGVQLGGGHVLRTRHETAKNSIGNVR